MGDFHQDSSSQWKEAKPTNPDFNQSESSDSDDEEVTLPNTFTRKISTNKRLDKSACLKEGYLQILRTTSFHKWKQRYFWLKGKTLYYGRDDRAEIYEEIDLTEASVAEYTLKNDNHAFQLISTFRNFVLATDSRKDMESWMQCIVHASQQKYFDPNDHQSMISGQHSWYITSHARPVYCNVCREALPGVTSHGLSCGVCRMKAHKKCAVKIPNNCKWSTLASVGEHIIEERDDSLGMEHQWIEGNLPVSSHCTVCEKKCGSVRRLQDFRCLWCKATVHTGCFSVLEGTGKKCPVTLCQFSTLSPLYIHSIDSDGLCGASNCRGLSPLLVFVNSKSGDNQGVKFLRKFKQLLNPAQVFDLMNGGPFPGLRLFQNFDQFRILVCGGDGSVSWVLAEVDQLNLHNKCQIGVLPLGTGNDLARVLGWGSVMTDDNQIINVIEKLEQSQIKMLDRWSILTYEWKQPEVLLESSDAEKSFEDEITPNTADKSIPSSQSNEELSSPITFESSMAECLHKILNSSDNWTVINYSKSLCIIVNRFLSQLCSLHEFSASNDEKDAGLVNSSLNEKCQVLQGKLNRLIDALNETTSLVTARTVKEQDPLPSRTQACSTQSNDDATKDQSTHLLMSRANSVKKAIKQIMDHTEAAVSLSIPTSTSSSADCSPRQAVEDSTEDSSPRQNQQAASPWQAARVLTSDNHSSPEFRDLPTIITSTEPQGDSVSQGQQSPKPTVMFSLKLNSASSMPDLLSSSCPAGTLVSSNRKISAISAFPSDDLQNCQKQCFHHQPPKPPATSLRVRNAIANRIEGHGSFIGKMLLANADAICAPVVPPFDDHSIQSEYKEKCVMNNYFGIGIDAKIALDFHQQREHHPERFRSRARNLMTFASLGGKEMITRTYRNFERRIVLECDGQQLPLPNLQGIVVLNIPSYSGGTNFWGTHKPGSSSEPFTTPSFDDKILEVMAVYGSAHIGVSRFINLHYHRIAQCRSVKITILGGEPVPMQVDGEAWLQNPGYIKLTHKNRAQMLTRDRSFEHALRSWSERQSKERLAHALYAVTPDDIKSQSSESLHKTSILKSIPSTSSRNAEEQMQSLVMATRQLIDCLTSLNISNITTGEGALSKCGEFISLDEATQAGLHELSICSTELCNEVQELLQAQDSNLESEEESMVRLKTALSSTQKELEKFNSTFVTDHHHKHKQGPFKLIGRLLGRYKKNPASHHSRHSSHISSKMTRSSLPRGSYPDLPVEQWSAEIVTSWLASLGLGEYSKIFIKNDIQGSELVQLHRSDLKDLGITKVGHLKRLESALKSLDAASMHSASTAS